VRTHPLEKLVLVLLPVELVVECNRMDCLVDTAFGVYPRAYKYGVSKLKNKMKKKRKVIRKGHSVQRGKIHAT
jgi:hypothetical protein